MKYHKIPINKNGKLSIFCYRLDWGLDSEAWYISANKDVCTGFDSTRDICFGKGVQNIYYRTVHDTLILYSENLPALPKNSVFNYKMVKCGFLDFDYLDRILKKGEINKLEFDTIFYDVPCTPIPYSSPYNMKFK